MNNLISINEAIALLFMTEGVSASLSNSSPGGWFSHFSGMELLPPFPCFEAGIPWSVKSRNFMSKGAFDESFLGLVAFLIVFMGGFLLVAFVSHLLPLDPFPSGGLKHPHP